MHSAEKGSLLSEMQKRVPTSKLWTGDCSPLFYHLCIFTHLYLAKPPWSLHFLIFDSSSKHPIGSLAQFQQFLSLPFIRSIVPQDKDSLVCVVPQRTLPGNAESHLTHGADALLGQPWEGQGRGSCLCAALRVWVRFLSHILT